MADATPTESHLLTQISALNAESATRRHQVKELKKQLADQAAALAPLQAQLATLATDRDAWKTKAESAPSADRAALAEAHGKLRVIDHRKVFDKVATEGGADPRALDDLYSLSGYKAEGDAPDAAAIKALVGEALAARPYLASPPADAGKSTPPASPAREAGAGVARGAPATGSAGRVAVRKSELSNPATSLDPAFRARLVAAQKAGTLDIVEG